MKRFATEQITNLFARFKLLKGKYVGMLVVFSGTNQAGQTLANTDCGTIQILKNGIQKMSIDTWILQQSHNMHELGAVENASAIGAAFRLSYFVPFTHVKDDVALDIQDENEWEVVHTFPLSTGVIVLNGTVRYYGIKADDVGVSPYELQIVNHHLNIAGAGTFTFPIYLENVHSIYMENDAAISHVTVLKDGVPFYDQVDRADITTESNLFTKTETYNAALPYNKIQLNPCDEPLGSFAKDITLILTATGACVVCMLVVGQFATPDRLVRSAQTRNVTIEQKVLGKPNLLEPVKTYAKSMKLDAQ